MPPSEARRGSRTGRVDSLISRLTIATTASDAGKIISSAASAASHGARVAGANAGLWRTSIQATSAAVSDADRAEVGGQGGALQRGAARRAIGRRRGRARGAARRGRRRAASSWRRCARRRRRSRATTRRRASGRAASSRPRARCWPLLRASSSIACSVWSRVSSRSAAKAGELSISRVSTLVAATISGQSASPIERSDVIALLTLRLSAACAAGTRVWISARCGATRSSHSK